MISITVKGGPTYQVNWTKGMNARTALERAYDASTTKGDFTFSLQYYGSQLGYLVDMINETYDTFVSKYEPYFFWEFLINGNPATVGIDNTILNDNDTVEFQFVTYNVTIHKNTLLEAKYNLKKIQIAELN